MRIRPITISAAFTVGLATLPLSTANAQSYPPPSYLPCSPFPLEWPFCAVGAILTTAAIIITAPLRALTPPFYYGYGRPPYYPPPPYYALPPYYAQRYYPPPPNNYAPH